MGSTGWRGGPINVVTNMDGTYTTLNNTRVLAAHRAGINTRAVIRGPNEPMPQHLAQQYADRKNVIPTTFGDAVRNRVQRQNASFRQTHPNGGVIQKRLGVFEDIFDAFP
jgi:hypothetical protein